MPKMKTHKGAAKRFKVTKKGKVMRGHAMHSHILTKKSSKRKRKLRQKTRVKGKFEKKVKELLNT